MQQLQEYIEPLADGTFRLPLLGLLLVAGLPPGPSQSMNFGNHTKALQGALDFTGPAVTATISHSGVKGLLTHSKIYSLKSVLAQLLVGGGKHQGLPVPPLPAVMHF
jgi:hypothetical protein